MTQADPRWGWAVWSAFPGLGWAIVSLPCHLSPTSRQSELHFIPGWLFKTVSRSSQGLLSPGTKPAQCHLCCILLAKASHKSGPDSKSEKEKPPPDGRTCKGCGYWQGCEEMWLLFNLPHCYEQNCAPPQIHNTNHHPSCQYHRMWLRGNRAFQEVIKFKGGCLCGS